MTASSGTNQANQKRRFDHGSGLVGGCLAALGDLGDENADEGRPADPRTPVVHCPPVHPHLPTIATGHIFPAYPGTTRSNLVDFWRVSQESIQPSIVGALPGAS